MSQLDQPAPIDNTEFRTNNDAALAAASTQLDRVRLLQATLAIEIPITAQLGVSIVQYDRTRLRLSAPLAPNINHKHTAFAGSLNALVTLSGWGLIWLLLYEYDRAGTIVIQDHTTSYLKPVTQDFTAEAIRPEPEHITRFLATLARKGRARIEVHATIREADAVAVAFQGRYVVQAQPPAI